MAYNTGTLITNVQQRIRDTGYSSTEILGYINDTQNDIFNEYKLPFMQDGQGYTTVVGVNDITNGAGLPTNYVQALDIIDSNNVPVNYIDAVSITYDSGWYFFDGTINLTPAPVTAGTLTLRYYKKPTELTGNSDVPEIPSEFGEALVLGAAYRVLQVKDNYDQAGVLQNKYDEIIQKLVRKYSQTQVGSPRIMRINRYAQSKTNY